MRSASLLIATVLAAGAFAFPASKERFDARMARRANGTTPFAPTKLDASTARRSKYSSRPKITNDTHIQYSSNWAGAVLSEGPGTWSFVEAAFEVPIPGPAPGQSVGAASAWVGIDGDTCQNAILQTGVDLIYEYGVVSYQPWFEWYPDYAYDFTGITINPGDSITAIVEAYSTTSGVAAIFNNNNGQAQSVAITSPSALCLQDAEWIVEDFESDGSLVTFSNFGTVVFNGATASNANGVPLSPQGANVFDIQQGSVLTSSSISGDSVIVTYV